MKILLMFLLFFTSVLYSKTMILEISYTGNKFKIINQRVIDKDYPSSKASFKRKDNFYINIKNNKNEMLESIIINNPKILTIPLPKNKNNSKYVKDIIKENGSFLLRFKYREDIRKIEIIFNKFSQILYLKEK